MPGFFHGDVVIGTDAKNVARSAWDAARIAPRRHRIPSGVTFYGRIFSYFRGDRRLLAALVALIWMTLLADTLQPYAIAALVDRVLSGDTSIHWGARLMLQLLPAGKTAQIIGLALIWLLLALLLETGMLLRAIVNARIQYNGTARV